MKKFLIIFIGLAATAPAFADVVPNTNIATTSYVQGAYETVMGNVGDLSDLETNAQGSIVAAINEVSTGKQEQLTSTNVTESGTGTVVTGVSASDGTVTVTKGEISLPVGAASGQNVTGYATVWVQ